MVFRGSAIFQRWRMCLQVEYAAKDEKIRVAILLSRVGNDFIDQWLYNLNNTLIEVKDKAGRSDI